MTARNVLADKLVEQIFGKKSPASAERKPQAPLLVTLQIEDARKARKQRQELVDKLKEF